MAKAVSFHFSRPGAWIKVTGEDAAAFLQSQFSNDLRRTEDAPVTYGLWLDRKGKIAADSFVLQTGAEEFHLYSYFSSADEIISKLEAFIVADDVELKDCSRSVVSLSGWGSGVEAFLQTSEAELPAAGMFATARNGWVLRGRRSSGPCFDWVVPSRQEHDLHKLVARFQEQDGPDFTSLEKLHFERLYSRIPAIPEDAGPEDLPHEAGLQDDAISFKKGCYLGQEVVSRLENVGKANRVLELLELDGVPNQPGLNVLSGEAVAGNLRSFAQKGGRTLAFAMLKRKYLTDTETFTLAGNKVLSARPLTGEEA